MKYLLTALLALLIAVPATAAPKKPRKAVALAVVETLTLTAPGEFAVQITTDVPHEAYTLWVAHLCDNADGVRVSAEYLPVQWADQADPLPTVGTAGPFAVSGVSCSAFVWAFPDAWTPVSNTVTYGA